jgi:acyl-coenzyme A thioesterase PaaI-like protein
MLLMSNMSAMDYSMVGEAMRNSVPWVTTAGIDFKEITATRAVAALPDVEGQRNHVGGPHAAVTFGLAETASGAVLLAAFADQLGRAVPLVARSTVEYRKLALGDLTAEAVLGRPAEEVVAELDAGRRPEFPVHVTVRNAEGATTTKVTVTWTLRPNRT